MHGHIQRHGLRGGLTAVGVFLILGAAVVDDDLIRRADESRGNLDGVEWTVDVKSIDGDDVTEMKIHVKARGFDVLGETLQPAKYKGNKVLMINHTDWFYRPGLSKAVPISRRQKLLGQASYGDIASTNYDEDYVAERLEDGSVDGEPCYVFDLRANAKWTTYDRIKYWVSKERSVGLKAEYYTVSGKLFKSARMFYEHTVETAGETRPFISEMRIFDELMSGRTTTLYFGAPGLAALPDYVFNLNLLVK